MLRGFSWKQGICYFSTVVPRHHTSALKEVRIYLNFLKTQEKLEQEARLSFFIPRYPLEEIASR